MTDQTGIMLCGHGSRDTNAVAEFEALASRIRERLPGRNVEFGFLEFARPIIRDGLDKLRERLSIPQEECDELCASASDRAKSLLEMLDD